MIRVIALILWGTLATVHFHRIGAYSWYSTIGDMKKLIAEDMDLLKLLTRHSVTGVIKVNKILNMLQKLRRHGEALMRYQDKHEGSMTTLGLLERYQNQWKNLLENSKFAPDADVLSFFEATLKNFPQKEDMFAVLNALRDLQKLYGLKSAELSEGYIHEKYSGYRLSTDSCEYLFKDTCNKRLLDLCQEWGDVANERIRAGEKFSELDSAKDTEDMVKGTKDANVFDKLCLGSVNGQQDKEPHKKNLKCYMWTNYRHPWLVLQPVPMEVMSYSPGVAVFYNLVSDKDIDYLKNLAIPKLDRAQIAEEEETLELDNYRVAHNCWLTRKNNSVIPKLDALVSAITGLKVRGSAEQLQVANYGIGGHYGAHMDPMGYTPEQEIKLSNRKATFMFYLSDVELGGATAFIDIGITVKPVKGSAVFWHNLLPSGSEDYRTTHGACPVVLGDKWVANKWIWETKKEMCKPKEYIGRIHYIK